MRPTVAVKIETRFRRSVRPEKGPMYSTIGSEAGLMGLEEEEEPKKRDPRRTGWTDEQGTGEGNDKDPKA